MNYCMLYAISYLLKRVKAIAAIRGGYWNNEANAGVFNLNLNNAPSNSNTNIGFRCCKRKESRRQIRYIQGCIYGAFLLGALILSLLRFKQ